MLERRLASSPEPASPIQRGRDSEGTSPTVRRPSASSATSEPVGELEDHPMRAELDDPQQEIRFSEFGWDSLDSSPEPRLVAGTGRSPVQRSARDPTRIGNRREVCAAPGPEDCKHSLGSLVRDRDLSRSPPPCADSLQSLERTVAEARHEAKGLSSARWNLQSQLLLQEQSEAR